MKPKNFLIAALSVFIAAIVFFDINSKVETTKTEMEYEPYSVVSQEGDDPVARAEYEFNMLKDPSTGQIPAGIRERELKYAQTLPKIDAENSLFKSNGVQALNWIFRGPINQGGRTRALAIDVSNENRILAGGISGGMWYSTDDGATWTKATSNSSEESVSCIVQDTRSGHTDTWYYGTGEYNGNSASGGAAFYYGEGIFKSTDKGVTWTKLPSTNGAVTLFDLYFDFSFSMAIDPSRTDSSIVYAAEYARIYRSNDGGNTWTYVLGGTQGSYTDLTVTSTGVVYATLASNTTGGGGIFRSTDGLTWTNITPGTWPSTYARTVLAVAPSNENIVYFLGEASTSGNSNCKVWKYRYPGSGTGAGDAYWVDESANRPSLGGQSGNFNSQLSYDLVIKVKPDDSLFVVFGGTNLFKTTDGFATSVGTSGWIGGYTSANISYAPYPNHHPDQHSLVFLPSNNKTMISGCDGGLKKTSDVTASTVTWNDISNGYQTSQFYSIAVDHATNGSNIIMGGLQDNGMLWTNSNNPVTPWVAVGSGDGAFAAIADSATSYYISSQSGYIYREALDSSGNYTLWTLVTPFGASGFLFIPPYVLDPNNTKMMYLAAGKDVWRNTNLTQIPLSSNNQAVKNWKDLTNTNTGNTITAVTASKTPANILFYGNNAGQVFRIDEADTGNTVPVNISGASFPSGGYVSCIALDQNNADNVMVVFSNYGVQSLFYTSNATTSIPNWTAVGGNLEPVSDGPSVRWAVNSNFGGSTTYFVGTSVGLFSTTTLNGSSTVWSQEGSTTIANNVVSMIDHRDSDGLVVVSTHGAGVFSTSQAAVGVESEISGIPKRFVLSQNYPNPFNPSTKINFTLSSSNNVIITIYDMTGKKVTEVLNQPLAAGSHTVNFNAANLASGTYIYRIQAGDYIEAKKMVLLK